MSQNLPRARSVPLPTRAGTAARKVSPGDRPVTSTPDQPSAPAARVITPRLIGIDLARGLAVLGMFAAHVGPDPSDGGPMGFLMELARGRSSALFALLAGFSIVLITGHPEPRTGRAGRQAVVRVLMRAVILLALGTALTALDTSIDVILAYYALAFVVALPLYRLKAGVLTFIAAATALVLPQDLFLVKVWLDESSWGDTVIAHDPLSGLGDTDGIMDLLFTGAYPVLTWIPFLIAGMAVARLDLTRPVVRTRLALTGAALTVLGYGGSWLALHLIPNAYAAVAAGSDGDAPGSAWWSDAVGEPTYLFREWLLVAAPHSQTTPSILGNTGVALLVVAGCTIALDRLPRLRRAVAPVIAVGAMSLSAYVLHIVAIRALGTDDMSDASEPLVLLGFVVGVLALAYVWKRLFRRGPLEYLLYKITSPARFIR
ncbi:DUF418 domain-containing protein [Streptomyces purpurogeneiscleroticus]|uniref:DUF418 domain-containing protein n=1 Tax=Streptomyces purpurogeneiscleroticus TaxID=68259 RepID=UPI0035579BF5|nr:hypothetical protein [Streptomyces purpurogeneiscleroticus]